MNGEKVKEMAGVVVTGLINWVAAMAVITIVGAVILVGGSIVDSEHSKS